MTNKVLAGVQKGYKPFSERKRVLERRSEPASNTK